MKIIDENGIWESTIVNGRRVKTLLIHPSPKRIAEMIPYQEKAKLLSELDSFTQRDYSALSEPEQMAFLGMPAHTAVKVAKIATAVSAALGVGYGIFF